MRIIGNKNFGALVPLPIFFDELSVYCLHAIPLDEEKFTPERISGVQGNFVLKFGKETSHHVYHDPGFRLFLVHMDGFPS